MPVVLGLWVLADTYTTTLLQARQLHLSPRTMTENNDHGHELGPSTEDNKTLFVRKLAPTVDETVGFFEYVVGVLT